MHIISVVVKDLRLKDEDEDDDLKIGPRGSSRTRTFLEDNNTAHNIILKAQVNDRINNKNKHHRHHCPK